MDLEKRQTTTPVIIIAGPTASGKSALALELAAIYRGVIVNADALQVYRDLRILSARPDAEALERIPHRLYGYLDAAERGSAGQWLPLAHEAIAEAHSSGRMPIVVGGTGLYLRALTRGLAAIPTIPQEIRAEAAALYAEVGGEAFRLRLAQLDRHAAAQLPAGDRLRLTRAFEVVRATGVPIGRWQAGHTAPPATHHFAIVQIMPPRAALYAACDARFVQMMASGALEEAAALADRGLDPDLPAMKGVGVPELLLHLRGEISLDEAVALAQRATRRYAKRQMTWLRHQLAADLVLDEKFSESLLRCSRHFIDRFLLTLQI